MPTAYPAKILLFGEHTLLVGSRGLAVPYPRYGLRWVRGEAPDERLLSFADYVSTCGPALPLDAQLLLHELNAGLMLTGNIPQGYGLGSSGAVCAALFDRYATPAGRQCSLPELRQVFARMESYFHGQSSGTDPLVCYLQQPLLLEGGAAGGTQLPEQWQRGWFLLDTGISRSASPLIERFLQEYARGTTPIRQGWMQPTEQAISALMAGDRDRLRTAFAQISTYQLQHADYLIPIAFREIWHVEGAYRLKVCGAGGGGMLLGLAEDVERTEALLGAGLQWLHAASHQ